MDKQDVRRRKAAEVDVPTTHGHVCTRLPVIGKGKARKETADQSGIARHFEGVASTRI